MRGGAKIWALGRNSIQNRANRPTVWRGRRPERGGVEALLEGVKGLSGTSREIGRAAESIVPAFWFGNRIGG